MPTTNWGIDLCQSQLSGWLKSLKGQSAWMLISFGTAPWEDVMFEIIDILHQEHRNIEKSA
jgi:hypothetical protein